MPAFKCSVLHCKNAYLKTKLSPHIRYHSFPRDTTIRNQWILYTGRSLTWNPTVSSTICSEHFSPNDFDRDLRAELLNLKPRKLLKPNTIPSAPRPLPPPSRPEAQKSTLKKKDEKLASLSQKKTVGNSKSKLSVTSKPDTITRLKVGLRKKAVGRPKSKSSLRNNADNVPKSKFLPTKTAVGKLKPELTEKSPAKPKPMPPSTKKAVGARRRKQLLKPRDTSPASDIQAVNDLGSDCADSQPSVITTNIEAESNSTVPQPPVDISINSIRFNDLDELSCQRAEDYNLILQYKRLRGTLQLVIHEKSIILTKLKRALEDVDFKNKIILSQKRRLNVLRKKVEVLEAKRTKSA